jgi:predicted ATPase
MGTSLLSTGDIAESRAHYDQALALYDPAEHRPLATQFGQDVGVTILSFRTLALWLLGYSEAAVADCERALEGARKLGHAGTLMYARTATSLTHILCGNYATTMAQASEAIALAHEKGALLWKAFEMMHEGCVLAATGKNSRAVEMLTSGIGTYRSTGATYRMPWYLSYMANANAELGQLDDAQRCIDEAMAAVETSKERWCEAEVYRTGGEIALMAPESDTAKAEAYFERALAVARQQQAKSWELRAAMSMARLWRDQGKRQQAHDLLAPIYGWFTEGFDTLDLKNAKALLDQLT